MTDKMVESGNVEFTGNKIVADEIGSDYSDDPLEGLVYSKKDPFEIILYTRRGRIVAKKRDRKITALAARNSTLYDGTKDGHIFETLADRLIAKRENRVNALCIHDDILYDASGRFIHETGRKRLVSRDYGHDYTSLCFIADALWTAGRFIYGPEFIRDREQWTYALCLHDGMLYDGGKGKEVCDTIHDEVVARRDDLIIGLLSHRGTLYDVVKHQGIFETFENRLVIPEEAIGSAVCTASPALMRKILKSVEKDG